MTNVVKTFIVNNYTRQCIWQNSSSCPHNRVLEAYVATHAFLLIFVEEDKKVGVVAMDRIVCAEFSNSEEDLVLFDTILRTMVHC